MDYIKTPHKSFGFKGGLYNNIIKGLTSQEHVSFTQ